jgi:hypothetical protein
MTLSLNDALNQRLDKSAGSPTVQITTTNLNNGADIAGIILQGMAGSVVNVAQSGLLTVMFDSSSTKETSISNIHFSVVLGSMVVSVLNASTSAASSPALSVSEVSFMYQATLLVPLIVMTNVINVQLLGLNVTRNVVSLLWNADFSYLCDTQASAPTLDLNNARVSIMNSLFQNVNTGL